MKAFAHARISAPHKWELASLWRRVPRGLRQARDPSTPRRIVANAEDIFAEHGLAGARMDEIARTAKVNKALLYYYFRDKEELHRIVLETLLSQLRARVGEAGADSPSPRKRLGAVVDHFFDFVLTQPNYPRLIQREIISRGPNMGWIVAEYYRPLHGRLVRLIEEGISAGDFRHLCGYPCLRRFFILLVSLSVAFFRRQI
jgi:AcrR family transcriptional regulator